ncbi:alcohol dehydrogenase catalytic domain-containing protein [Actinoplanes awajinensis]|uniref:Alcohol dehydrogenase n=1 Tax=Actinoplanes awajinensis subsp. mycoplanecinus TaxID=135947 RepID=A0A101JKV8_9ACTN|nr:alcohol dehydrogenase catalytic domain-containing protein [Actinoplanes awajinensis]KUL28730.1 alcohol dehydrogenase [Actinoplanes awajinensis subsp. mycoplanecinus]
MRAVVIDTVRARPEVRDVPEPIAPDGGVVVRVLATGMCRSDWHGWAGHDEITFPHVPGHELAGVVASVGAGVERWRAGDRVTVPFVCGCGHCEWCRSGQAQICPAQQQPGFTHWGSFAEYVALHAADTNLIAIPERVDFVTAAALGCRFATAYRALAGRSRVTEGEWVTVLGAGGVGLSAVMIARALGARVIAVDRNPEALALAAALGAEHTLLTSSIASSRTAGTTSTGSTALDIPAVDSGGLDIPAVGSGIVDVPAAVAGITGGGSHVAVDAVGSEQTCADAILSLRRRGRHVQVGLLPPVDGHPRVPMARVIAWELDLLGSHGMAAADYPAMMALIADGSLQPQRLIERTIGLAEAAAVLPDFDQATVAGMTMLDPTRP